MLLFFSLYAYESYIKCDLFDFTIFGLAWSVQFAALTTIVATNILYHLVYFHILCYYLYLKLIKMNNEIAKWGKKRKRRDISLMQSKIDSIHCEINDCDKEFWSNSSCIYLWTYMTYIACFIFSIVFGSLPIIINLMMIYMMLCSSILLSIYILSAALVHSQAKKTYQSLTRFNDFMKKRNGIGHVRDKLKVKTNV
jgi:hypothetical protein